MQLNVSARDVQALIAILAAVDALTVAGHFSAEDLDVIARGLEKADGASAQDNRAYVHMRADELNQKLRDQA